ncbi:L-threonylcarbamoyladenylate synthase [Orrella sp. 11846]|uniref:L-threonylcarbamoyladenylate synthase n=1 Tax=Orrella sp. 11846 TaxID=3409913 RepID=UPI003B5B973B
MSQLFEVHPDNPQSRLIAQAVELIDNGGVVATPTDSGYALVARLDDRNAADELRRLRGLDHRHHLTVLCKDLSEISHFAKVDNVTYRLLKSATPGPWTFILQATKEVPKRVSHPSRKTIGIRVPEHPVLQALLGQSSTPLLSTTLIPSGEEAPLVDPEDVYAQFGKQVQGVIDAGNCAWEPTTVIDLSKGAPVVERIGRGDPALLGLD